MSSNKGSKAGGAPRGGANGGKAAASRPQQSGSQASAPVSWEKLPKLTLGLTSGQFELWKKNTRSVLNREFGEAALTLMTGNPPEVSVGPSGARSIHQYIRDQVDDMKSSYLKDQESLLKATNSTSSKGSKTAAAVVEIPDEQLELFQNLAYKSLDSVLRDDTRRINEYRHKAVQMQSSIWMKLSRESQERIELHPLYETNIKYEADPIALWTAIEETHKAFDTGNEMRNLIEAKRAFAALSQGPMQSLSQFKSEFDAAYGDVESRCHEDILPSEEELAIQFICSLDSSRFESLQLLFHNRVKDYPQTRAEAYEVAAKWIVPALGGGNHARRASGHAVFHYQTADTAFVAQPKPAGSSKKKVSDSKELSKKDAAKKAGDQPKKDGSKGVAKDYSTYRCRVCNVMGHIQKDCPSASNNNGQPATALPALGSLGDYHGMSDHEYQRHCAARLSSEVAFPAATEKVCTSSEEDSEESADCSQVEEGQRDVPICEGVLSLSHLPDNAVLLDTGATRSVFSNRYLLADVRVTHTYTTFTGIGGTIRTNQVGTFVPLDLEVHYAPNIGYNVLSFTQVRHRYSGTAYDGQFGRFVVPASDPCVFTCHSSGLWVCTFPVDRHVNETVAVQTVKENESMYSKREIREAKELRELSKRMAYPSSADLSSMLRKGLINNAPVSYKSVQVANDIYGPEVGALKGKTKLQKPTVIKPLPLPRLVTAELTMLCDLMFVEGDKSLVSVTLPLGLLMVSPINDKHMDTLRSALNHQLREYRARDFSVTAIWSDREGGVLTLKNELLDAGIKCEAASTKKHVPGIEVRIRVIKERCRAVLNTLPFLLPRSLLKHLVAYAVSRINMIPTTAVRSDGISPREAFTGRRMDCKVDLRIAFGTCVQINTFAEPVNSMAPRTELAIALEPTGSINGSVNFWVWRTKRVVSRESWSAEIPFSPSMIAYINDVARVEGRLVGKDPKFVVGNHEVVDVPMSVVRYDDPEVRLPLVRKIRDMTNVDSSVIPDAMPAPVRDSGPELQLADDLIPTVPDVSFPPDEGTGGAIGGDSVPTIPASIEDDGENASQPPAPPNNLSPLEAAALESRRVHRSAKVYVLVEGDRDSGSDHCLISVRKAIEKWDIDAMIPINAEFIQILNKKVFTAVLRENLSKEELANVIRSHMFLTEKFTSEGVFERLKARLVAGGNEQDRSLYDSVTSPTVGLSSLFMVIAIAASERRTCKVVDVTGAYLNALMGDVVVHMRIDGHLAVMLVKLRPEYRKFVNRDGSIIVRLNRALYGCIESAKL